MPEAHRWPEGQDRLNKDGELFLHRAGLVLFMN